VQHTAPVFLQLKSRKLDYERNEPMLSARRPKSKIHLLHSSSLILVDLINCEFVTCENSKFSTSDLWRRSDLSVFHTAQCHYDWKWAKIWCNMTQCRMNGGRGKVSSLWCNGRRRTERSFRIQWSASEGGRDVQSHSHAQNLHNSQSQQRTVKLRKQNRAHSHITCTYITWLVKTLFLTNEWVHCCRTMRR